MWKGRLALVACTIISRNYLSHARVLAQSYLEHHPGDDFFLLVVDGLPDGVDAGAGMHVVDSEALGCPYYRELCFKYDVTELCTATKPTLLRFLFDRIGATALFYLDPDILVMRPLTEARAALEQASLLLTPHLLEPLPLDGQKPTEMDILACGAYNLGFLGLRNCQESRAFLDWWEERLRDGCLLDPGGRHFVDQKWVDYAPSFFPSTTILRDDTYNVAMWNLGSRHLERRGEDYFVNGRPLTFFHFSGFGAISWKAEAHIEGRFDAGRDSVLGGLLVEYRRLQEEHGFAECRNWEYGFRRFNGDQPICRGMRRLYLSLSLAERARFPAPFVTAGADSFLEWALTPTPELAGLSPFLLSIYRLRPDVMAAFPEVLGAHRDAFREWARTSGAQEMEFDPRWVRGGSAHAATRQEDVSVEIADIELCPVAADDVLARWLDLPRKSQVVDAGSIAIAGWVLGRKDPIEAVEILSSGQVLCRAPLNVGRPEVAASHPNLLHAARCGFRAVVAVDGRDRSDLLIQAVLGNERRLPISIIHTKPPAVR